MSEGRTGTEQQEVRAFKGTCVTFFGAKYSAAGMHPDPKKIQGIMDMTAPTGQAAVTKLPWYGQLHGYIHSTSLSSD